ncbi:hypothetical protein [Streptosporangium sp. V21-05]|uniref:hypothetical protein n=1 Tax=Streptosporangium sp. V21-05 TaxID=3446115 RepID=UPI003F529CB8
MNARELLAHYESLLVAEEWILWNPVTWTVVEPMTVPQSIEQIGGKISGVHDFHLEEIHLKEGMEVEDPEAPTLFIDSFEDKYFFFDTYDLTGTQDQLIRLLGEDFYIWGLHVKAGTERYRFVHTVDGQVHMNSSDILRVGKSENETSLAEGLVEIRSAWRDKPNSFVVSAAFSLISLLSGAVLDEGWLNGRRNAFVTENIRYKE